MRSTFPANRFPGFRSTLKRRAFVLGGASLAATASVLPNFGRRSDAAQGTPSPDRMSAEATEDFLRRYLDDLVNDRDFTAHFADDIVVGMMEVGQTIEGKEAAGQAIIDLHTVAFDATPDLGPLVVGEGTAGLEVVFVGTHTGDFAGVPATGRSVRVPYSVSYEVAEEKITALRLYGLAGGLILQVAGEAPPVDVSWREVTAPGSESDAPSEPATPCAVAFPESTGLLLSLYLDALVNNGDFAAFYAPDIVAGMMEVGQVIEGRAAVEQAITDLHSVAFDATPEIVPAVVGFASAALEAVFAGTHTGTFSGIPATGRPVRIPYSVYYEMTFDNITALRIYGLVSGLLLQLGSEVTPQPATPVT